MNQIAPMPTRAVTRPLRDCKTLEDAFGSSEFMDRIRRSVPKHVNPERMLRTFIMATSKTPDLMKCNLRSVLGAMLTCSQLGFEPNTPLGHAYLIPFANRRWNPQTRQRELVGYDVQLILGYTGLLDLSYRSCTVKAIHCDVVWAKDDFSFSYGTDAHLRHVPRGAREDGERPVWAYMHAQLDHGQSFEVIPYADVLRIRNQSQGYRAALAAKEQAEEKGWKLPATWTDAPWVKHEVAMARKTALRAGSKWLPRSIELAAALALDEAQDRSAVDFGSVIDGSDLTVSELPALEHQQTIDATAAFAERSVEQEREPVARGAGGTQVKNLDPQRYPPGETIEQAGRRVARDQIEVGVAEGERDVRHLAEQRENENGHDTRSAPAARREPAAPAPKAPHREVQHYYLVDEAGELVEGDEGHTLDPVVFAQRFIDRWLASRQRDALIEHNADAIADARAASRDATNILAEMEATEEGAPAGGDAAPASQAEPASLRVDVPQTAKGTPDLKGWLSAVQSSLQRNVHSLGDLTAWMSVNGATYRSMPKATKTAFDTLYAGRREALIEAGKAQQQRPQIDDDAWAAELIEKTIKGAPTRTQLEIDTGYQFVREQVARLERERPDLHGRIHAAYMARLQELKAAPAEDPS